MEYISKQKLKAFAKRFSSSEKHSNGQRTNVPITLERAENALKQFVSLDREPQHLKASFIETRVKVLEICLKEKTPSERWISVRDCLADRLESQVLHPYLAATIVPDSEVEPQMVLRDLLTSNSFLSWGIKLVVLFNVTDDNVVLPKDVNIDFGSGIEYVFPEHRLVRRGIALKAHTRRGEIVERLIPYNRENFALIFGKDLTEKFSTIYSILVDQDSNPYTVKHGEFFDKFNKSHQGIVKKYNFNSSLKPSFMLSKLGDSIDIHSGREKQLKFLKELTGKSITKWNWKVEEMAAIDVSKIIKEYFPDLEEETESISFGEYPPRWKPNSHLFDEDSLRYELTDLYLQRFSPQERENLLRQQMRDLSIFNLKTFRDLVATWENKKDIGKVIQMLQAFEFHYYTHRRDPKEREKWIEYVRITNLIQKGYKPMTAYRMISPNEKPSAVKMRYRRQLKKAKKSGYNIKDPQHLEQIKSDWDLFETGALVY